MESSIDRGLPEYNLYKKEIYEPLLLECLNSSCFFREKSGGGFAPPDSESNGECDAIGKNGCYDIDFKCLISQDGAKNLILASVRWVEMCKGITARQPSVASMKNLKNLKFPDIWGFLASGSLYLNKCHNIELTDVNDVYIKSTIKN
jgi:hypothetical protein